MSEPRWIRFDECSTSPGRKTHIWNVAAKADGLILGSVFWYVPWRCFVFGPTADCDTVYEQRCLRDIADYMEARTAEHKARCAAAKAGTAL
jgi:hypothetical protein